MPLLPDYPSGFDAAAILVIDGIGEAACSTLAQGEGARILSPSRYFPIRTPPRICMGSALSDYLGFSPDDGVQGHGPRSQR